MRRAGITNSGNSTRESSVIDQDSRSMTASVRTSAITLLTTPDSVHVNARWAPMTSLLRRLTSAPVRVRVKNATGIRCTWPNTARRRSRMIPSPMRDDCQRSARPAAASATAINAMRIASITTRLESPPDVISSTTLPASTGVSTVSTAPTMLSPTNAISARRCGLANCRIRRSVSRDSDRRGWLPCIALSSAIQWLKFISMGLQCAGSSALEVNAQATVTPLARGGHTPGSRPAGRRLRRRADSPTGRRARGRSGALPRR